MAAVITLASCAAPAPLPRREAQVRPEPAARELPIVAAAPEAERAVGILYRSAEKLYSQGLYRQASEEYIRFIAGSPPDDPLVDNAYFKAGLSLFQLGRYRDALRYFQTVTDKYPGSETRVEAMINTGICHYHLGEHDVAGRLLAEAEPAAAPGQKAYINFYRAGVAEQKGSFPEALDMYVASEMAAEDKNLIELARARAARILHNFLGEKDMIEATKRYSGTWPAKMAFEELSNIYRRAGDESGLAGINARYKEQFPPEPPPARKGGPEWGEEAPSRPRIGVVAPLTGMGAEAGREVAQGIQLAFASFQYLVREKNVQLIIKDSASGQARAETAMRELAADSDTIVIIGPVFSRDFERAAQVADAGRIPIFSPSATAEGLAARSDFLFRNTMTSSIEAKKIADLAINRLGLRRLAILYPDNIEGLEVFDAFRDEVARLGGSIEKSEKYGPGQTDFGEQIRGLGGMSDEELRKEIMGVSASFPDARQDYINYMLEERFSDRPAAPRIEKASGFPLTSANFLPGLSLKYDAVFIAGVYDKVGLILPELEFYNIKKVKKLAGKGANDPGLLKIAEKYAEGLIIVDGFFSGSESAAIKSFNRSYTLAFREEPAILAAQAYDAARIILSAMAHGAASRRGMTDYIRSLRLFEGVSGVTSMGPMGEADKSVFYLTVEGGRIVEYDPTAEGKSGEKEPAAAEGAAPSAAGSAPSR